MAKNAALGKAREAKQDEFYTQLSDIEAELRHYRDFFRGKVVFCNCDDPYESNFFKYFAMSFNALGLKKLIATCYASSPVAGQELPYYETTAGQMSFFPTADTKPVTPGARRAYKVVITEVTDENGDGAVDLADVETLLKNRRNVMTLLDGDGDFRSAECVELLKQADVIVTNPPFSLFREYVAQLMEYGKYFLIIGNQNALKYKEIFPLIMDNKIWLGYHSGDMAFMVPDYFEPRETRYWQDKSGQKWRSMGNVCWYTNIDIQKRHESIILFKHYTPEEYPKYANYDAINVDRTTDIPCDYFGEMGVPITFMDKYNPDQFVIIGGSHVVAKPIADYVPVDAIYSKGGPQFYLYEGNNHYRRMYERIVIRRKQVTPDEN